MFTPTGTRNGPDVKQLQSCRSTRAVYCNGSGSEVIGDNWMSESNAHRSLKEKWTGCTVFMLHDERSRPQDNTSNWGFVVPELTPSGFPVNPLIVESMKQNAERQSYITSSTNKTRKVKRRVEDTGAITREMTSGIIEDLEEQEERTEIELLQRKQVAIHPHLINSYVVESVSLKAVWEPCGADDSNPVSYTHLTLPTICSV